MSVTVVIPTYNERENLSLLVPAVLQQGPFRVLIVDDASPDGTGELADRLALDFPGRVEVLHRKGPRTFGRSYVDGFAHALSQGADLICQMDADLSHNPEYLPAFVRAAEDYDVVIGSRYSSGISVVDWPLYRLVLSVAANRYIRAVTRLPIRDCTSGFRCWRRAALAKLPLEQLVSNGYAFQVETIFEAARRGCRIGEMPIVFVERRHGRSKLSGSKFVESFLMPWRLVARGRARASD
jgi:dolichol-phosphate mannosyltransferase